MITTFRYFDNDALQATAEEHHRAMAYILPLWLYEFSVECSYDQGKQLLASASVDSRYRRARVTLYPGFFTDPYEEQRRTIRHEYVHVLMGGLAERVAQLTENDATLEYHHEAATEDIARLLESRE